MYLLWGKHSAGSQGGSWSHCTCGPEAEGEDGWCLACSANLIQKVIPRDAQRFVLTKRTENQAGTGSRNQGGRNTVSMTSLRVTLNWPSYSAQNPLCRNGVTHSELSPPASTNNQDNPPQTSPCTLRSSQFLS